MSQTAIIVVTWNSSHLIGRVLGALSLQTKQPERILIIDNGSSDKGDLIAVVDAFPLCELVLLPNNIGFAAANNLGVERCEGMEFVALLNPDAFPEPGWLAALLRAASENLEAAAFGSRLLSALNPDVLDGAGDFLTVFGRPGRRGHGLKEASLFLKNEAIFGPCAAAALYRREALVEVGGFDEEFFCYVEDVDVSFRLLLRGYESIYVRGAVALHVGSATTGRRSEFSIYHGQRNIIFNYIKNMPPILFWLFLAPHILLNILYLIGAISIGRGSVAWRAKRDAVLGIRKVWRQRCLIQKNRKVGTARVFSLLRKCM